MEPLTAAGYGGIWGDSFASPLPLSILVGVAFLVFAWKTIRDL